MRSLPRFNTLDGLGGYDPQFGNLFFFPWSGNRISRRKIVLLGPKFYGLFSKKLLEPVEAD